MAHYPKPFFRPARNLWYVQLNGRQFNLGADQAAAFKNYHALMQQHAEAKPEQPITLPGSDRLVVVIVDDFLDWCQKNRSAATYEWYLNALTGWANGDANYDGAVDGTDFTLLDNAFNRQGPQL